MIEQMDFSYAMCALGVFLSLKLCFIRYSSTSEGSINKFESFPLFLKR